MIKNKILKIPYYIFIVVICFTINLTDGFDLIAMSVSAPIIAKEMAISSTSLGLIFSSALLGMTFGAIVLAPLGDNLGRRKIVLLSIFIISSSTILTAFVSSLKELIIIRFICGLGIGSVLASSTAIVSEFVPRKYLSTSVIICASGFTVGTIIVGPLSVYVIESLGWQFMFIFGGGFGFLTFIVAFIFLPESIEFLKTCSMDDNVRREKIRKTLCLIGDEQFNGSDIAASSLKEVTGKRGIGSLFDKNNKYKTLYLWGLFFCTYWTSYFLINWIPQLFFLSGADIKLGIQSLTLLTMGGLFGAWVLGFLSSRYNINLLIAIMLFVTAVTILIFSIIQPQVEILIYACMFIIGFALNGSLTALYAVAAELYPVKIRTTGVGWGIGVGRTGAILSPIVAGLLVNMGYELHSIFLLIAMPMAFLAAILAVKIYFVLNNTI